MRKVVLVIGVLVVIAAVGMIVWQQGGAAPDVSAVPTPPAVRNELEEAQQLSPSRVQSLDVSLTSQFFSPDSITINAGDRLNLYVRSLDRDHEVAVFALNRTINAPKDRVGLVQLNVPTPGVIPVVCTAGCDGRVEFKIIVK